MRNRLHVAVSLRVPSLIALLLIVSTCKGGKKDSRGPAADTMTLHLPVPVLTANPLTYLSSHERWVIQYTHASLFILGKESMRLQPELAVSLPEMSADKLRWTIRLRQDARWHDGKPVTARDVEASFRVLKDTTVDAARLRALFSQLKSVKALDDFTCQLTYSEPYYFALLSLADFPVLPAHVLDALEKPGDLNDMKKILGSGPYELTSLTAEKVVLDRNDDWFGVKPKLKRIIYRTIRDTTAAVSALKRGEIDAMGVPYDQWQRDLSKHPDVLARFHQLRYHRPSYKFFGWNCSRSLFSDKRTRKALALAFDVQKYLRDNFSPGSRQVTGPFFFKGPQHDPDVKPFPYDPVGASKLLEEAGWKDSDGDGTLDRDGERFAFSVMFVGGMPELENRAAALKDACRKLGIQVTLRGLNYAALSEQLKQGDFDCVAFGLGTSDPEIDPYQILHSDSIRHRGFNYYQFIDDEVDALIEKARVEFNDSRRNDLYHRLHRLLYDEQPFLFLLAPEYLLLVDKRFQNVRSYGLGLTPRIGIEWEPAPVEEKKE